MHRRSDGLAGTSLGAAPSPFAPSPFAPSPIEPDSASSAPFDRGALDRVGPEAAATRIERTDGDIRCNADGSIDFDSSRALAAALRRHAMRDPGYRRAVGAGILAAIVALAVVILIEAAPVQPPHGDTATGRTHTAPIN
jgi:ferric-dicitrate binding protein FerR (iron transport regulator)